MMNLSNLLNGNGELPTDVNDEFDDSPASIEMNSANSTERHLLDYEKEFESNNFEGLGLDLSLTVLINGGYCLFILNSLSSLTPDFSGLTFHMLSIALNSFISLPHLANDKIAQKKYYLAVLTLARVTLTSGVNATVINGIDKTVRISNQSYRDIKTEICIYEKCPQPKAELSIGEMGILGGIITAIILVILWFRRKKDEF